MLDSLDRKETEDKLGMLLTTRDCLGEKKPKMFARISLAVAHHFRMNGDPVAKFRFTQDAANAGILMPWTLGKCIF